MAERDTHTRVNWSARHEIRIAVQSRRAAYERIISAAICNGRNINTS